MNSPSALEKPYTVLAAVDFSETSDRALREAFRVAKSRPRSEVHVVHVASAYSAESVYLESFGAFAGTRVVPMAQALDLLREQLETVYREFRTQDCTEEPSFDRIVTHFLLGQPARSIAQLASDVEADLLVLGTHGRTRALRLLMGSVAESTMRLSPCPVLVVRPEAPPPDGVPAIEPACPRCLETRRSTGGAEFRCPRHATRQGRRHTYHWIPGARTAGGERARSG